MTDSNETVAQAIARTSNGRRVTPEQVQAAIVAEYTFTGADGVNGPLWRDDSEHMLDPASPLYLLTFCVLVLSNGFTVVGQSACADPANFDENIGKRIARDDAVRQVWPLLGYELRTYLMQNPNQLELG